MQRAVAIYGASGHTGRLVAAEARKRGWTPILSGRDQARLALLAAEMPGTLVRAASVEQPSELDRALEGACAVVNCAGPFATTGGPVVEAALRAGIPYLDVAAEIEANLDTFANHHSEARARGITIVPAMAFYGGLGDLLASVVMDGWVEADEICIAYGLTGWVPTPGTRQAGSVSRLRREGRRIVYTRGGFDLVDGPAPAGEWLFPDPLGHQRMIGEFTMADAVTISRHFRVGEIRSFMTAAAVADLTSPVLAARNGKTQPAERFIVEVVARNQHIERRISAAGRDIYATSAPLVMEAVARLLDSDRPRPGAFTPGQLFDAREFLRALSPDHLTIQIH